MWQMLLSYTDQGAGEARAVARACSQGPALSDLLLLAKPNPSQPILWDQYNNSDGKFKDLNKWFIP